MQAQAKTINDQKIHAERQDIILKILGPSRNLIGTCVLCGNFCSKTNSYESLVAMECLLPQVMVDGKYLNVMKCSCCNLCEDRHRTTELNYVGDECFSHNRRVTIGFWNKKARQESYVRTKEYMAKHHPRCCILCNQHFTSATPAEH